MADHQKIHPVAAADVEAQSPPPPTAPLMPRDASRSDKADPPAVQSQTPPPLPASRTKQPKKRSGCCRFLCWTVSVLLLLLVAIAVTVGILYLVFRPKLPKYSIDGLSIARFEVGDNMSLSATFNLNITARNPNKRVGIYYLGGGRLSAWYADTKLCEGAFPKFYQGHRNRTVVSVAMTGQTEEGSEILGRLRAEQQKGSIPLRLRARVWVRVKLGKLKLMKMKFRVRCGVVVDNLAASDPIRIRSSSCKFRYRL